MKDLKCNRCSKTVQVSDDYEFLSCPLCREKQRAYNLKRSEIRKALRKLDKESKVQTRGLTNLPDFMQSFSAFKRQFERHFHEKACSWEDYLRAIEHFRTAQAQAQAKIEISKRRQERSEEKILNEAMFPFESAECKTYRLLRMKNQRSFSEITFISRHSMKCASCTKWLEWFKFYQEEQEMNEGDISAFDKPISGANPYDTSSTPEETHEQEVIRKGLTNDFKRSFSVPTDIEHEKDFFKDSNQDYRKIKKTNRNQDLI